MNLLPDQPLGSPPPRILAVDDEEMIVLALRETLTVEGFSVLGHTDPLKALQAMAQEQFAVILSDQKMPQLSGLELLAQARRLQPNASRILITALLSLDTVIEAINKGEIYRFIVKPWLREELIVSVRNGVQRYELICRNESLQARTIAMNRELQAQVTFIGDQNQELLRLNQTLQENLSRSIELCLHMLEAFHPTLGNQARRVNQLCRAMADVLQLPPDEARVLAVSGWLHDIGLIGVPRSLIKRLYNDPESLAEAERQMIHQHPLLGEQLAHFVQPLAGVATTIRGHHERFDGQGYPDRLQGEGIPRLARLLAVAVSFAESNETAVSAADQIRLDSGTAFDPEAVRVFLRALPRSQVPRKELEVLLSELRPGMLLAKGIYTANGMLLVPEGQRLTQTCIEKVLNHNLVNPIQQSLLVYC